MEWVWTLSLMVLERTRRFFVFAMGIELMLGRFDNNFKLIKRKGTIVSVGNASGAVEPFSVLRLAEKNLRLLRPS